MSPSGHTIGLDFGIGNIKYLGQGLAAPTLIEFVSFYNKSVDPLADTFFIDPDKNNPRAKHVYSKAGFIEVDNYAPQRVPL
ncbi:acetyltransferase [Legionella qingyii]|uniref:Acetyltransferase n=1 Tax=Legionella qingyii TaxID=2184757 RepID=A0A317U4B2_9GAMM|nr:GNAT family N-acetyltransferase [Legionella qingyii]PWY56541.1 acetyltransferase [Legionella qingyii]PWY57325.1 acetyltransferase [Legionella qingyii]RUR24961.1 GNAT family N-acetyltransferase [Legionella qingyii]RUR28897.1 GNAT family N-acetyltransferase [Legionella qingyii]